MVKETSPKGSEEKFWKGKKKKGKQRKKLVICLQAAQEIWKNKMIVK